MEENQPIKAADKKKPAKRKPAKRMVTKLTKTPALLAKESPEQSAEQAPVETAAPIARVAPKKKRVPVGLRDPMAVHQDLDPNFNYRFVRNKPGRIDKFMEGGYEMVTGDVRIGDPNIAKASGMGSAFSIASGDNEDRVYLMRVPKEFYDEDQQVKQSKIDAMENQLKQRPKEQGFEGDIKLNR